MKNNLRIGAGLLAMYILSLPLALALHMESHTHQAATHSSTEFAEYTLENDSECQLCSFYFDQQLYLDNVPVPLVATFSPYFHQGLTETVPTTSSEQCSLRGPPVV